MYAFHALCFSLWTYFKRLHAFNSIPVTFLNVYSVTKWQWIYDKTQIASLYHDNIYITFRQYSCKIRIKFLWNTVSVRASYWLDTVDYFVLFHNHFEMQSTYVHHFDYILRISVCYLTIPFKCIFRTCIILTIYCGLFCVIWQFLWNAFSVCASFWRILWIMLCYLRKYHCFNSSKAASSTMRYPSQPPATV